MADTRPTLDVTPEQVLLGILVLLAAERDERVAGATPRKTELILTDAGFSAREVSQLTGKEYEAVRSSIKRAGDTAQKKPAGKKRK